MPTRIIQPVLKAIAKIQAYKCRNWVWKNLKIKEIFGKF